MAKAIGYRPVPTNKNIGGKTHGSFKNSGQKSGDHGAKSKIGAQKSGYAKEKLANMDAHTFMKKTIKGMRSEGTKLRRIQMMPNSGAFH